MVVLELMKIVRNSLQDAKKNYWTDNELLDYYSSGIRSIAAERLEEPTTTTLDLTTGTNEYIINGVLRYISIKDSNGIVRDIYPNDTTGDDDNYGVIIVDHDKIYVNTPETGVTLTIKHISLPDEPNITANVRSGDEAALKYFMLSKAYEKEMEMENFQKSQYFFSLYLKELQIILKHKKIGFINNTSLTKGYFY